LRAGTIESRLRRGTGFCDEGADFLETRIMSLKFGICAVLLLAASPTAAQPPAATPPAPQPAVPTGQQADLQRAAMAFGQCVSAGIHNVSASTTPEAGAAAVLGGCTAQRAALAQSVDAMIAAAPEDKRAAGHAQFESQMGQAQAQIADAIRQSRATPPAPATPPH
jgi:hypothetical protein